ncbi:MAG: MotA/TolQ/ExbB proton channel family protein [Alphaproteobacteria bacterium]|nr:MotA/TolQ/ExbB proton channel family protein [Alphaproteobacteria bacterium]
METTPAEGEAPIEAAGPKSRAAAGLKRVLFAEHTLALKAQGLPPRMAILVAVAAGAVLLVLVLGLVAGTGRAGAFWFGRGSPVFGYPLSIQNLMHVLFALGLAELYVRSRVARFERAFIGQGFLPEDEETVLQIKDLGAIRRRVAKSFDGDNGFLPSLIDLAILRLQTSRSVDQAVNVVNASLELIGQRLDLRYQLIRYLIWVIPTVGFIGTVVGIAGALAFVNPDSMDLKAITGSLAVAFDTTVIALLWSAILVLIQHIVQKEEEMALNQAGHYCLKNLINRVYLG